jgi:hypothetical protein
MTATQSLSSVFARQISKLITVAGTGSSTVTVTDNTTGATVGGIEDNELDGFSVDANRGTSTQAYVDAWAVPDALVMFALRIPIPSGSGTVSNAKIRLYLTEKGGAKTLLRMFEILRTDWEENTSTYNAYKTGNNWTVGGAQGVGTDRGSTILSSLDVAALSTGAYVEFTGANLTALVQNAVNNSLPNINVIIQFDDLAFTAASYVRFVTSEGTDGGRPQLVYDIQSNGVGVTASLVPLEITVIQQALTAAQALAANIARQIGKKLTVSSQSNTVTFVGKTQTFDGGFGADLSVTAVSGIQENDFLLMLTSGFVQTPTVSGFTVGGSANVNSPDGHDSRWLYKVATNSEPGSYTVTGNGGEPTATLIVLRGIDPTTPISVASVTTTNTASNTFPVSATLTGLTASANDYVVAFLASDTTDASARVSFAEDSGTFTELEDYSPVDWTAHSAYGKQVAAGATGNINITMTRTTGSGNAGYLGMVFALKTVSTGTDGVPLIATVTPVVNPFFEQALTATALALTATYNKIVGKTISATNSVSGAITFVKSYLKDLPATSTILASLNKYTAKSITATSTLVATLTSVSTYTKALDATQTVIADLRKDLNKTISSSVATVATVATITARNVELYAGLAATAVLQKYTAFTISASSALVATLEKTKALGQQLIATLTMTAMLERALAVTLAAQQATAATIDKLSAYYKELSAQSTVVATFNKYISLTVTAANSVVATIASSLVAIYTLTATQTVVATLATTTTKFVDLTATALVIAATMSRRIGKELVVSTTIVATIVKAIAISIATQQSIAATLTNIKTKLVSLDSALVTTATLTSIKAVEKALNSTLSLVATLQTQAARLRTLTATTTVTATYQKVVAKTLTATRSLAALVETGTDATVNMVASVNIVATFRKALAKTIAATVVTAPFIGKFLSKTITASSVISATLQRAATRSRTLTATVSATASIVITAVKTRALNAQIAAVAVLDKFIFKVLSAQTSIEASYNKFIRMTVTANTNVVATLQAAKVYLYMIAAQIAASASLLVITIVAGLERIPALLLNARREAIVYTSKLASKTAVIRLRANVILAKLVRTVLNKRE